MEPQAQHTSPLRSDLADDPDMVELLDFFVAELGERIASLQSHLDAQRLGDLRTLAHQLKGAAGGYGYPDLSRIAGTLEASITEGGPEPDPTTVKHAVDALVDVCRRAIAGHQPA
ncbi:MAG: Hpt domain-containing protein [Phycisphaeraceae bacterium]|nr:MAG: Hpt domain-containing protein [Phycisphaeraceae bacterium]